MKPYPYTPEQLAWLVKLETTDLPQTRGALHRCIASTERCEGHCCLGLAAVVLKLPESESTLDAYLGSFEGSSHQLFAFDRLHLRSSSGEFLRAVPDDRPRNTPGRTDTGWTSLTELNDELGWSFKQIAAFIRRDPWNVFVHPARRHASTCLRAMDKRHLCDCDFYKQDGGHDH